MTPIFGVTKECARVRILGGKGFSLATLGEAHCTSLAYLPSAVATRECTAYGTLVAAQWYFRTLFDRVRWFRPVK